MAICNEIQLQKLKKVVRGVWWLQCSPGPRGSATGLCVCMCTTCFALRGFLFHEFTYVRITAYHIKLLSRFSQFASAI